MKINFKVVGRGGKKLVKVSKPKKKPKKVYPFTIIIDNQEQKPYSFPCETIIKKIKTGDYSIEGLEHLVTVERKSKSDLFQTIGQGRERFKRELIRMTKMNYAAIVIESSLANLLIPPRFTKMHPKSIIGSLLSWSVRYNLPIFFAGSRSLAKSLTFKLLEKFEKHLRESTEEEDE